MATSGSRAPHPLKSTSIGLKKRQNATFSRTAFNICPGDQNIVSNSDITHHLPSLFSKYSRNLPNIVSNSVMFRQHVTSMASLSFIYPVLDFLYIATLLISISGDVELTPGPLMNPNSVNSSFDSYATLTNSGLSIMNLNIQSLKLDILTVEAHPYDVLVFTETWLSSNVSDEDVEIPNFK